MADVASKNDDEQDEEHDENQLCLYEYLDHTADVQIHSWGKDIQQTFEAAAIAMFAYMTDLSTVKIDQQIEIIAEGHDINSLLFSFLDEFLYVFSAEPYLICRNIEIIEFDKIEFKIKAIGRGESFNLNKHPQGTEVKAITYSNMQIYDNENQHEIFVIIDI